jgi:hypothetical protein
VKWKNSILMDRPNQTMQFNVDILAIEIRGKGYSELRVDSIAFIRLDFVGRTTIRYTPYKVDTIRSAVEDTFTVSMKASSCSMNPRMKLQSEQASAEETSDEKSNFTLQPRAIGASNDFAMNLQRSQSPGSARVRNSASEFLNRGFGSVDELDW